MATQKLTWKEYYNKVHGGWLGRVIGSQLGGPLELRPYFYIKHKHRNINKYVKEITGDEVNDDEIYEIVALLSLEQHGIDLSVDELAQSWKDRIYKMYFTAEKAAIKNLQKGLQPPKAAAHFGLQCWITVNWILVCFTHVHPRSVRVWAVSICDQVLA